MEVAILTAAYELNCQYEWTQWERFGRNPADPRHIEQSTIDIIKYNKPLTGLGEKETAVISFARELFGERKVSSETFAAVLRLFGPKGTVDLVELMGLYSVASLELTAFDEQLQVGQTPLLPARSVTVTANCVTRYGRPPIVWGAVTWQPSWEAPALDQQLLAGQTLLLSPR
jgi:hypothetical protein